ncbi:MAG: 2'-5' RNA ligase family protein [Gemmatimonadota bacterium]|nr:2'-5' RNA ligase family protein [Gemmatimonadota bacterium]
MIADIGGAAGETIRRINEKYDPRLARYKSPHVTITGSSGVGPIAGSVSADQIREKFFPVTSSTAPLELSFGVPMRFMQTEIIVLPLDPHGALRALHDRLATSGLPFQQARFTFTPHCTLSLYPTLTREAEKELLSVRVRDPVVIDRISVHQSFDPQPPRKLLELVLTGEPDGD